MMEFRNQILETLEIVSEAGALATMAGGPQGRLGAATTADRNAAPSIRPQSERRGIWNRSGLRPRRSKLPHACQRLARLMRELAASW